MSPDLFASQIPKTGFVLEYQIADQLRRASWTVISNRYYVDDAEESVREIDLVAYRATKVQHFDVYTALLISCKKSESNVWALLSRAIDLDDPNADWQPAHMWSNDKALAFQIARPEFSQSYHKTVASRGVGGPLALPAVDVFAFQEMNKSSGAPQNDKAIFAATTSLMKAQAYEIGALPLRRRNPAVYQFNLLSLVDAELIRLYFDASGVRAQEIDQEHYIARYIIKKQATSSRIRFLRASAFEALLGEYSDLHRANCAWFDSECNAFYSDILKHSERVLIPLSEFRAKVYFHVRWTLTRNRIPAPDMDRIYLSWSDRDSKLHVSVPAGADGVRVLNDDPDLRRTVADALKKLYRFDGPFEFQDDDIPF